MRILGIFLLFTIAVFCAGCDSDSDASSDGADLLCGPGTHLQDGECVLHVSCGEGTHEENGVCVPNWSSGSGSNRDAQRSYCTSQTEVTDCERGKICVDGVCATVECIGVGSCLSINQLCYQGTCTAVECSESSPCSNPGVCVDGLCIGEGSACGDGTCDEGEGLTSCADDCVPEVGYDVLRAPVGVDDLLSQDVANEILDTGMNLYEGNAPPSVVGRYRADSLKILFDGLQGNPDSNIMPYEIDISEDGGILMICAYQDNSDGSECSVKSYLSGAGVCFTLVSDYAGRVGACEYDRIEVISGCMDEWGNIADYQSAFFLTSHAGDCDGLRAEYVLRVLKEDDLLAEAINK